MEKANPAAAIAVIVFAKTFAIASKTRIAHTEGQCTAQRIYRELLSATASVLSTIPYHVAYAGGSEPGELSAYFPEAQSFFEQTGTTLGERMKQACLQIVHQGAKGCIVIGCDCPLRTTQDLQEAATLLTKGVDVVLGPVEDGGYHLAGVNARGVVIFDATQWSSALLMDETLDIIKHHNLRHSLLPTRFDIDTIADYVRWKELLAKNKID